MTSYHNEANHSFEEKAWVVLHKMNSDNAIILLDDIEIHFLELPKLDEEAVSIKQGGLVN